MTRDEQQLGDGYVLRGTKVGLRIFDKTGAEIPGRPHTIASARDCVDRHKIKLRRQTRKCLCCARDFSSAHIGNRLCAVCSTKDEGLL